MKNLIHKNLFNKETKPIEIGVTMWNSSIKNGEVLNQQIAKKPKMDSKNNLIS